MLKEVIDKTVILMQKSLNVLSDNLDKIRVGRASSQILSSIKISYCDNEVLLGHISTINVVDNNLIIVTPFDKSLLLEIDKAIRNKNLNSIIFRDNIKVNFPPLSVEGRQKLIKHIINESELTKISIRNIRRDSNNILQNYLKNKFITVDEEKSSLKSIQNITDKFIIDVDNIIKYKKKELLEI
ncbi:MAG TPA: ribosome-recycling factor [Candidatus Azosocius sp. HAIN]